MLYSVVTAVSVMVAPLIMTSLVKLYKKHCSLSNLHEGNTMRKIMGNKPQVSLAISSAIIIHSPLQISWNDLLHQGQTADVSIIRAKTGTFSIETLDTWHPDGRPGLV
jgi:hypothetical protein